MCQFSADVDKMFTFFFIIVTNLLVLANSKTTSGNICTTPTCNKIAKDLLESIDFSTDPCDDFFNFTCGRWIKENRIPDDQDENSILTLLAQTVENEMKVLLENPDNTKTSSKAIEMTRNFYKNCADTTKVNSIKSDPLIKALNQFGGWPIFQTDWNDSGTDITDLMGKIIKDYTGDVFISTGVSSDWKEPNKTTLYIDQPPLGLGYGSRGYYLNDSLYKDQMDAYTKYCKDVLKLLAADMNVTKINYNEVDDMIEFEKQLAKIIIPEEQMHNHSQQYNPMTIAQLTEILPTIKFKRFFELILPAEVNDFIQNSSFRLVVLFPSYMNHLNVLLSKSNKNYVSALDERYQDLQQADAIRSTVGYPDFILNDTALDDYYKKLDYKASDSFFEIRRRIDVWITENELNDLLKPFDRDRFIMSPATVNAYYSPSRNSINFPAAILKYPLFQKDLPNFVNYGAIGAIIGHEITHGFDDQGSQFDKFGGLSNWWSKSSFINFQRKTECMVKQYDQYIAPGTSIHLNGLLTLSENIADNGGLKEAYEAYLRFIEETGKEELRLPNLDEYTNEQLFFISHAYSWCGKLRPESEMQHALTDVHSTLMFRVNGVAVNSQDFADAFQCKEGTKMNPEPAKQPKCSIW